MVSTPRQRRRYRERYPEKVKEQRIRYLDKKIKNELGGIARVEKKLRQEFTRLTRLLFDDMLPKECCFCKSGEDLEIHHIRYVYPLKIKDLVRLCKKCHIEEHQRVEGKKVFL